MNMTEESIEDGEEVKEVEVKRGRGRPKIPDELKKTKPKVYSGLPRGRPRIHHESGLMKNTKKPKVLEITLVDEAQISLIEDFTNNDLLDTLPVKFVTKPDNVRGRPINNTISQQIELMVIKPTNSKHGGRPRIMNQSDYSDEDTPPTSQVKSQPSTSKGRGRPRKNSKVRENNDSESYNTPSTSRGRGRPRKSLTKSVQSSFRGISRTPQISYTEYNESDYSDDESYSYNPSTKKSTSQPSTSKGRGRPRKYPRIDIDDDSIIIKPQSTGRGRPRIHPKVKIEDIEDESNSASSSESKSKGRGRPRKNIKKTISSSSSSTPSKGRGRPRKYPITPVSDTDSGIHDSPSTSKGRGRPRKYPKIDVPIKDKPKKGRGRPRKLSTPTMILTVEDGEATIQHVLTDNNEGILKQQLGRGRPRKEVKVILDRLDNGEGNTGFESQMNNSDLYPAESDVEEDNVIVTEDSKNCEDIEYSITINNEQTTISLEDDMTEPVSNIIS